MEDITLNYLIIFISILITTLSQIFISLAYSKYKKILNNVVINIDMNIIK